MKRIKFTSVFLVAIILLVNLATLMVYSENGTHVIVEKYIQDKEKIPAKSGDAFSVEISYKNTLDENIEIFVYQLITAQRFILFQLNHRPLSYGILSLMIVRIMRKLI